MGGGRHAARRPAHSEISGEHRNAHPIHAVYTLADSALLDRRSRVARHTVALSHLEHCSCRVAGENQLQLVSMAATVLFQPVPASRLQTASWDHAGLSFLLLGRTTHAEIPRPEDEACASRGFRDRPGSVRSPAVLIPNRRRL